MRNERDEPADRNFLQEVNGVIVGKRSREGLTNRTQQKKMLISLRGEERA